MADTRSKNRTRLLFVMGLVAGLSGCTTAITSGKVEPTSAPTGIVYQLPATELKLTAKFELTDCVPTVRVRLREIILTPLVVTDRSADATYLIKTDSLKGWLKQIDSAKITLASSRLSKVSYDVTDKTKDAVGQVVSIVKKIGALSNPGLAAFSVEKFSKTSSLCKPGVIAALNHMVSLRDRTIPNLQEALRLAYDEFSIQPDESGKKRIKELTDTLSSAISTVTELSNQALLVDFETTWTPSRSERSIVVFPTSTTFSKWFRSISDVDQSSIVAGSSMKIDVVETSNLGPLNTSETESDDGIFYRVPGQVAVKVFGVDGTNEEPSKEEGPTLFETSLPILQLGFLAKLDLSNSLFEDNKYDIVFGVEGELEEFSYAESVARISELGGAVESAIDSKLSKEEEAIDRQISLLGKQKALLEAELEVLNAKTALESKLDEISEGKDGGAESNTE